MDENIIKVRLFDVPDKQVSVDENLESQNDTQADTQQDNLPDVQKDDQSKKLETKDEKTWKDSVVDWIKGKQGKEADSDYEEVDVPDKFATAATEAGWSEDDIMDFVLKNGQKRYSDDELLEMIQYLAEEEDAEQDKNVPKSPTSETKPDTKSQSTEEKDDIIAKLESRLAALEKGQEATKQISEEQEIASMSQIANKVFDELGGAFGKTEELPIFPAGPKKGQFIPTNNAFRARSQVWDKAIALVQTGQSFEESLQDAIAWHKGKYMERDIQQDVVKKLKEQEKYLTARKQSKGIKKTFTSEREEDIDFVKGLMEEAGQNID